MFKNQDLINLENELEALKKSYANLEVQGNTQKQEISSLKSRLNEFVNRLTKAGNSCFTSIMNTLNPILDKQKHDAKITDKDHGLATINSLQMAMQIAYTTEEKIEQLRLQEEDLKLKLKDLNDRLKMHEDEMALKRAELDIKRAELEIQRQQLELQKKQVEAEIKHKEAQTRQIQESIRDNRFIKAMEHTSSMVSMALSANAAVPKGVYALYFGLMNTLITINKLNEETGQYEKIEFEGPEGTGLDKNKDKDKK